MVVLIFEKVFLKIVAVLRALKNSPDCNGNPFC